MATSLTSRTSKLSPSTMGNERVRNTSRNDPGQSPTAGPPHRRARLKNRFQFHPDSSAGANGGTGGRPALPPYKARLCGSKGAYETRRLEEHCPHSPCGSREDNDRRWITQTVRHFPF